MEWRDFPYLGQEYRHRGALILASGALIIAFGIPQLLGRGFAVGPLARLRARIRGEDAGAVRVSLDGRTLALARRSGDAHLVDA